MANKLVMFGAPAAALLGYWYWQKERGRNLLNQPLSGLGHYPGRGWTTKRTAGSIVGNRVPKGARLATKRSGAVKQRISGSVGRTVKAAESYPVKYRNEPNFKKVVRAANRGRKKADLQRANQKARKVLSKRPRQNIPRRPVVGKVMQATRNVDRSSGFRKDPGMIYSTAAGQGGIKAGGDLTMIQGRGIDQTDTLSPGNTYPGGGLLGMAGHGDVSEAYIGGGMMGMVR